MSGQNPAIRDSDYDSVVADRRGGWRELAVPVRGALTGGWVSGVPPEASACHARWWQFETWLRSLTYVELRAKFGSAWLNQIPPRAVTYAKNEARLAYMTSADSELLLSYLEVSDLFELIGQQWEILGPSLIDQQVWQGRLRELRQIRHRNSHCRRPHPDDLRRLEQTLRDLESGAFRAVAAFNRRDYPDEYDENLDDPLVEKWIRRKHPTAIRLIEHAASNYGVDFELNFSHRPWAAEYEEGTAISGREGYLWHAVFVLHNDGIDPQALWTSDTFGRASVRDSLVYLCLDSPYAIDISFSALDNPGDIADAIGAIFDAILPRIRRTPRYRSLDDRRTADAALMQQAASLDPRVQACTAWATVEDGMKPITLFSASSGVT